MYTNAVIMDEDDQRSGRYWLITIVFYCLQLMIIILCSPSLYLLGGGVKGFRFVSLIIGTQRSTHPQFCSKTLALDRGGEIGMLEPN